MAGTMALMKVLDSTELTGLTAAVVDKLNSHLSALDHTIDEHKAKYEKIRVNSEQRYFEIEKQLKDSNAKLETESTSNVELKQKVEELEKKYNETFEKLKTSRESQEDNISTTLHLTKVNEQLEGEKRELGSLLEKRNREIDSLSDELKELSRRASEANTAKCEAVAKLDEIRSQEINKEYQLKRLEQEKGNIQKELDFISKDLQDKTNDLLTVRREKSTRLLEIQFKLEEKTEENSLLQATIESLKKSNAEQAAKIDSFIQKIKDLQDSHSQAEEQYNQEIQARVRLADLYKQSSTDAENQVTELTGAVKELQKLLKDAATAHTDMEKQKDEFADKLREEIDEREKKIEKLNQELVHSNELLDAMRAKGVSDDQVEGMFPTAAATSRMLKSGMSLTEIYNEYVIVSDSLQKEKDENRRLNTYLDQILQEIEEKAPILKAQRTDYENALQSIDRMTRQLTSGMVECKNLRQEADEKHRQLNHLQRDNQKQQQQIQDMSTQIQYLVKEIEELKGGRVVRDETVSSSENMNSSAVITQNLVTFGSIEELTEQNQKLLAVVRDLSEKKEEEENATVESKTQALQDQLNITLAELTEMKEVRDRQADLVESVMRQRDMYRVLLQQSGTSPMQGPSSLTSTPRVPGSDRQPLTPNGTVGTKSVTDEKLEEANKALKELQSDFTNYKKGKLENDKIMTEQYDKSKQEVADLRVQNARLSSQLDFAAERYKVLQGNSDGYRKEIALLRDRSQKYSTSVAKHEQTINSLREDLMTAQQQVAQSQARLESVRQEKELIKASEQRKGLELESLRRESNSQTVLMANLQAIQNNLERNEYETKQRLGKQIEILERDNVSLNKRLEAEERHHGLAVKQLEGQIQELRKTVDLELKGHQTTKDKLAETTAQLTELQEQLSSTKATLSASETRLASLSGESGTGTGSTGEEVRDLKTQLAHSKSEIESLKEQLQSAKQHAEQYKTVAQSVQESIQQQNEASKEFQESLELKLNEATEAKVRMEQKVNQLEQERQEILTENIRITEESHSLNADLRKQLSSIQNELQEALERRKTAIDLEASAKEESERQIRLAAEAQDKYERELMLHAADVEALTAVRKELEDFNSRLRGQEEAAKKAENQLAESQAEWKKREELLVSNNQKESTRVKELIAQTRALHDQMGKLSQQVISVQERAASTPQAGTSGTAADDSSKSSEQLLEVVRYLRKEKDIAEGKLDVVETESSRLKQRCDQLEKQLEEANKALTEEREKLQADLQTVAQHADLMHKVESNNLLQDSNRLLREEREQLHSKLQEAEAKIRKLEESIQPLQEESRAQQAQKEALAIEKLALASETERWKARTNSLIEQSHKTDPEEHKRLIQEREKMRKQLMTANEDIHKARTEVKAESARLNLEIAKLQKQLEQLKQDKTKLSEDVNTFKHEAEEKGKDVDDKIKTINQLKKIGRKYKEQAEKVGKEFDEYKSKQEGQQQQQMSVQQASTKQLEVLEQKLKEAESKREQTEQNLKETEAKKEEFEQKLKEAEGQREELNQKLKDLTSRQEEMQQMSSVPDSEVQKLKEDLGALQQKCNQQTEEVDKLKDEKSEMEKKQTQSNKVLQTAKTKLQSLKETTEKLTNENTELKQKLSSTDLTSTEETELRLGSLRTQYENKISKLEAEISQLKETASSVDSQAAITKLQKENNELQAKIQQLQRQWDTSQKVGTPQPQVHVSRPGGTATVDRNSASALESPKTANIRPIASSPAAIKPQPVSIQPPSVGIKATASIRPMAITPTTVAPLTTVSVTPTATVMPTTVSQQDLTVDEDVASPVQQLFPTQGTPQPRPTQQVQRVTPQADTSQDVSAEVSDSQTETVVVEPQPSTSRDTPSTSGIQTAKRQREDTESPGEDTSMKRAKVTEDRQEIPSITVTNESAEVVLDTESAVRSESQESVEVMLTPDFDQPEEGGDVGGTADTQEELEGEAGEEADDDDDVIYVASEDEDGDEEEYPEEVESSDEEEDIEEAEDDEEYGEDEEVEEAQEVDFTEDVGGEMEEGYQVEEQDDAMQTGSQEQDEDEDVVIVEDEGQMESQEPEVQPASQTVQPTPQTLPPPLHHHALIERQMSASRNQLAPFMLGSNPSAFEDGDDCMVPSTPTLVIPRRGDGFAEAVSSPQVHQRFVFGSGGEPSHTLSGLAQLETQAALGMGMDDTRMDLTQLEEGSSRSVPSTPLHTSAPGTSAMTIISEPAESLASESSSSLRVEAETADALEASSSAEVLGDDGDEEILEGIQGEEEREEEEEAEKTQTSEEKGEGSGETGDQVDSREESEPGTSQTQDKSQDSGKPKIQRIMWESSPPAAAPLIQTPQMIQTQTIQPHYRGQQRQQRGTPQMRGNRGNFPHGGRGSGGPSRRPMRGRGMYQRRPPMY